MKVQQEGIGMPNLSRNEKLAKKLVKQAAKNGREWLDTLYERQDDEVKRLIDALLMDNFLFGPSPLDELRAEGPKFKEPDGSILDERIEAEFANETDKVVVEDVFKSDEEMYAWAKGFFAGRQDSSTRQHLRTLRLENAVGVELSDVTVRVEGDAIEISYMASVEV